MKFLKKALLFVTVVLLGFSLTACYFGGSGNSNNGGGNNNTQINGGTGNDSSDSTNNDYSEEMIPSVKAIAGVYVPDEISEEEKAKIDKVYAGLITFSVDAIKAIQPVKPQKPEGGGTTIDAGLLEQYNNALEFYNIQRAKQDAIKTIAENFLKNPLNVKQDKIGLFESEVTGLINELKKIGATIETPPNIVTRDPIYTEPFFKEYKKLLASGAEETTLTKVYTNKLTEAELSEVRKAVVKYLSNPQNIAGSPVEGETSEDGKKLLVEPIVRIQVFEVKTYELLYIDDSGKDTGVTIKVNYLDDNNGYSTKGNEEEYKIDRMILPSKKWLTIYFSIAAGQKGFYWLMGLDGFITATPVNEITSAALDNYTYSLTSKTTYTSFDFNSTKYQGEVYGYEEKRLEDIIEEFEKENGGEIDEETLKQLEEEYGELNEKFKGQFQFEVSCYSDETGERAPKLGSTKIDNVTKNDAYRSMIKFVKKEVGGVSYYSLISKAENLDNTLALNFNSNASELTAFQIERLGIMPSSVESTDY